MNSLRPHAVVRIVAVAGAAMLMAACGTVHTGSAAVVDGDTISMKTADAASMAHCRLSVVLAKQQGGAQVSAADSRRQAVTNLVVDKVAHDIVKRDGLRVDPAKVVLTNQQIIQVEAAFHKREVGPIRTALERSQYIYLAMVALGEQETGLTISAQTQAQVENAGQAALRKAVKDSKIAIDPRFGLNGMTTQIAQTGSLSVPQNDKASTPTGLPPAQRCS